MDDLLKYKIGITLIDGIGHKSAKRLIAYCGGIQALFEESLQVLRKIRIPGVSRKLIDAIRDNQILEKAEAEIEYIKAHDIKPLFYLDDDYPNRLKYCDDGPVMLFMDGDCELNNQKVVSIVGTRTNTRYGEKACEKIVQELAPHHALIVSGIAYGIDITAHRTAVQCGLPTIGVVAHSLDFLYPSLHQKTADQMKPNGGLLSEHIRGTDFHPSNFPERNRIVAGMADCTIVIESPKKGGSLITANIADSYHRDVFAVPGGIDQKASEGCNNLIRSNKAHLLSSVKDLEYIMGWEVEDKPSTSGQKQLFVDLKPDEKTLVDVLQSKGQISIDVLSLESKMTTSQVSSVLLNLEFNGVVKALPGKVYELS